MLIKLLFNFLLTKLTITHFLKPTKIGNKIIMFILHVKLAFISLFKINKNSLSRMDVTQFKQNRNSFKLLKKKKEKKGKKLPKKKKKNHREWNKLNPNNTFMCVRDSLKARMRRSRACMIHSCCFLWTLAIARIMDAVKDKASRPARVADLPTTRARMAMATAVCSGTVHKVCK